LGRVVHGIADRAWRCEGRRVFLSMQRKVRVGGVEVLACHTPGVLT